MIRKVFGISLLTLSLVIALPMEAQDTLRVSAPLIADTLYLDNNSAETIDMDTYLLNQIAQQSEQLYESSQAKMDSVQAAIDSIETDRLRRFHVAAEHIAALKIGSIEVEENPRSLVKDSEEDRLDHLRAIRQKRSKWRKEATVTCQLSENYVTGNWYQGGSSSLAMLTMAKGQVSYHGDKLTWENTGEWREGLTTDFKEKVNTSDDLLRLYSKAGYKVIDKLYLSSSVEYEMHFLPIFKDAAERQERKSGFASPMRLNISFGLDYKPVKDLSVVVSPLTYKMVYVMDTVRVDQTNFGVAADRNLLNEAGSSLRVEYKWKPIREVALDTRFYMYTNYTQRVELDWEINCDFIINRFFSTRLMVHPRYEFDKLKKDAGVKQSIQFKELLSIGFAHKFH